MKVLYVVTGTPAGPKFERKIKEYAGENTVSKIRSRRRYVLVHQLIKNDKADLIFGNTYAKYIARDEDIPDAAHGFPIYDRVGHQYFPIVGYRGAMRLLERMLNVYP